ncbi:hypothetical protein ACWIF8_01550 [Micromonospora chalcea]|uniref:hypothetical protein n=1 Tax=Micromonospora sp. B006 TaxID=2201999 RepID=UPI000E303FA8|nr:hypothetical protein [Micromonospora sp. B006]
MLIPADPGLLAAQRRHRSGVGRLDLGCHHGHVLSWTRPYEDPMRLFTGTLAVLGTFQRMMPVWAMATSSTTRVTPFIRRTRP